MVRSAARLHLREWAVLSALLLLALAAALHGGWLDRADNGLYDSGLAWSGRPPAPDILILAIDETSLARVGRWPWPRQRLAEAVERLAAAGSGPVLLDVILSEPQRDDPGADVRLAAALQRHGRVVLPVFMPSEQAAAVLPLPPFAAQARLGHAQALVDSDGVSRRYLPRETAADKSYPHVSGVLLELWGGAAVLAPTPGAGARLVPLTGPAGHYPRHSLAALLEGGIRADRLRGKVILVGVTATGLGDNLVTPLAGVNGAMPGVEFVANIFDALRSGRVLQPLGPVPRLALSVVPVAALMLVLLLVSPRMALLATVAAVAGAALLAWGVLVLWDWWWPPAAPMAVMALAYPLWSWRRLETSLDTMTRETLRMRSLVQPAAGGRETTALARLLDPVESRIAAISQAVDQVADALAVGAGTPEARQYREDMMRHLAHDLRAPLVSLRSLAEQLSDGGTAADAAVLARIDACARRSLDLTEQFLLMGRAQALDPAGFSEVDLVQVLHQSADDLWEDAQRSGSRVARRCGLDNAPVRGDARLLQRALLNLGWNALRYGPPDGVVTLSLDALPDGYALGVHDEGQGFAPEAMARLSQRYAQGKATPAGAQGHGLGLALVQLVAQKHNATVHATLPPEGGFSVSLHIVYIA